MEEETNIKRRKGSKKILNTLAVIAIIAIAVVAYFYFKDNSEQAPVQEQGSIEQELGDKEVEKIVEKVRKHITLPSLKEESPIVATIVDIDSLLKEQPFYQGAQNGDILLIYGSLAKAIIYNPREDRLINVGPVQVNQNTSLEQAQAPEQEQTPSQ